MTDYKHLIKQLRKLDTEQVNPETLDIDQLSALAIAKKINAEDKKVAGVVERALPQIAQAAELYADTLKKGGRVFYLGAGTSGRLGVLDAAECPPTFGTEPSQIIGLISGGHQTLVLSREGAEDDHEAALHDLKANKLTSQDLVIGIAASISTPYTLTGLSYAAAVGCKTVFVVCNQASDLTVTPEVVISVPVGPEVITGSTRMKSATAQKMTLNIISTTAMVLLGKTYGNLMVDLQARSDKLAARSRRILMELLHIDLDESEKLLNQAQGSVKLAIVMKQFNCNAAEAAAKLAEADGFIRKMKK